MKLTILGASGRVGRQVAQLALSRGHEVTVCVRDAARWNNLCLTARCPDSHSP